MVLLLSLLEEWSLKKFNQLFVRIVGIVDGTQNRIGFSNV